MNQFSELRHMSISMAPNRGVISLIMAGMSGTAKVHCQQSSVRCADRACSWQPAGRNTLRSFEPTCLQIILACT